MPKWKITDPNSGKQVNISGDSPPTEQEIEQIFSSVGPQPTGGTTAQTPFSNLGKEVAQDPKGAMIRFGNKLLEESPVIAGAGAGALAGSPGGPIGMTLGAMAGGTLGSMGKQGLQAGGVLPGEAPKDINEASERVIDDMLLSGAGEGLGQAVIKPFSMMSRGFSRKVTPEGREAVDFFRQNPQADVVVPPAKATDSRVLDIGENLAEASLLGGESLLQNKVRGAQFVDDLIGGLIKGSPQKRETLGKLFDDAISGSLENHNAVSRGLFERLDASVGSDFVDIGPVMGSAVRFAREAEAGIKSKQLSGVLNDIINSGRATVDKTGIQRNTLSFSEAQQLRSDLLAIQRQAGDPLPDRTIARIKALESALETQMEAAAAKVGPKVVTEWRRANAFWKRGKETFNDRVIQRVLSEDPSQAAKIILQKGRQNPDMIRRVRSAVNDKNLWEQFQADALSDFISRSTKAETGEISPAALANALKQFGGPDGAALRQLFPAGQDKALMKLARVKGVLLRGQPDATGRLAVQIGQITAAGALMTGNFKAASATILLGPLALAKAFTSPRVTKFLIEGGKSRPGLRNSVTFTTRLSALLAKEGIEHDVVDPDADARNTRSPFSNIVQQGINQGVFQ